MNINIVFAIALLLWNSNCLAVEIPSSIFKHYQNIISLVKENNAKKLSALIKYPLKRQDPLPYVYTPKQFISYYSTIFDKPFKQKLMSYNDSCVFEDYVYEVYGLVGESFHGDLWINKEGKITSINYLSSKELKHKDQLIINLKKHMHPSVRNWQDNRITGKSKGLTIRIDMTDKGLRYVSWSKGRSMSEKPDLIIYNGIEEPQGTIGGWTWTFVNGKWTYIVDDLEICDNDEQCGLFLRLLLNDTEKSTIKLKEIK